jgi:hypothetical protein
MTSIRQYRQPRRVFYISETRTGGSLKYIQDLQRHYTIRGVSFWRLSCRRRAIAELQERARPKDVLIFQYLLNTDFSFGDIAELVDTFDLTLVVPIHDKYFLNDRPAADLTYHDSLHVHEAPCIPQDKMQLLRRARFVVFPSRFIYNVFRRVLQTDQMVVVPHMDEERVQYGFCRVPPLRDQVRLGIITPPTFYKGINLLEKVYKAFSSYNGCSVSFLVYADYDGHSRFPNVVTKGAYCESDIYRKLEEDQVHGLLFLNNYPETYCYALTKGLNAGIPILYTDMGAVGERIADRRASTRTMDGGNGDIYIPTTNVDLMQQFASLLHCIETRASKHHRPTRILGRPRPVVPAFYDDLFKTP